MRNAMKLLAGFVVALLLSVGGAQAQSACSYIAYGAVLTAAQWNACFQQKADFAGGGSLAATEPIVITTIAGLTTWSFDYTYAGTFTAAQAIHAGTLAAGANAFGITATQPVSPVAAQSGIAFTITGAGSAGQTNNAVLIAYAAGYTGASNSNGLNVTNANLGTAALLAATGLNANKGIVASANGATTGWNVGIQGGAGLAQVNIGVAGITGTAANSATNIGGLFSASNTGSSPVFVGAFVTLGGTTIPVTSAGLIVDNVATAVPVALFRVNGTTDVEIQASGGVTIPATVTGGDKGVGTLNATSLYVAGTAVLTANQSITLSGDVTGSGATSITTTAVKVNGVAYGTSPSTNTVPVVTGTNAITYETVPVAALANATTTVNGVACTLASTCTVTTAASSIAIGTTTITSGTTGRILYDNSAVIGELATIPLANGGTNAALAASNGGIVYSTASAFAVLAGTVTANQCLLSGSSTAPSWGACAGGAAVASVSNSDGTLTISPTTGAVVASIALGHANTWTASQTLSAALIYGGVTLSNSVTGTGSMVLSSSPTMVTPTLGVASATSLKAATIYGGAAAGSSLNLYSTSSGSPSGDTIALIAGGVTRQTILSGGDIGMGTETNPQIPLVVSSNAQTGLSFLAGTEFGMSSADGVSAVAQLMTFNNGNAGTPSVFSGRAARGTGASPANLQSGDSILEFDATPYVNSVFNATATAKILFAYNDTSPNTGTHLIFYATPAGTTSRAVQMLVGAGVSVGTSTTDPGAGNLAISGNVTSGGWQGSLIGATYGGTGVNNGARTLTVSTNAGTLAFGAASKTLTINNSLGLTGTDGTTMTFPPTSSTVLTTGNTETMGVGLTFTAYNAGTQSSGTFTPSAANANYQYLTNNGAFTMAAPSTDSAMDILVTNGASAGTITYSGFTVGANTGDAYVTTNAYQFIFSVRRINGISTYVWKALQ